jgi:hypothetical protein
MAEKGKIKSSANEKKKKAGKPGNRPHEVREREGLITKPKG